MKSNSKLENYQAKQDLLSNRAVRSKKDNRVFLAVAAGAVALAFAGQLAYFSFGPGGQDADLASTTDQAETPAASQDADPTGVPNLSLAEGRAWSGSLNLNGQELSFELAGDLAPQAVANFISLSKNGFYEGVSCHRLVTSGIYVLQCGDPSGDGTGGPGYNWGPIENAPEADLYTEGVLAMARRGGDDSSMGSQFFIVYQDSTIPSDAVGGYTVFGSITSGLDGVKAIAEAGTIDGSSDASPLDEVLISSVSVE
ncbi:MAG: peptidylprolyl isomerase [Aquiluna sp.]|jgi:peptidyl-prolyl cis-trans isomerase B (cyclophilin B)